MYNCFASAPSRPASIRQPVPVRSSMRSTLRFIIAVLLPCAAGLAQSPLPPAPHRHVVTISPTHSNGNEPAIAVNRNNPDQVVVAFQPATIEYSTDGSHAFTKAELPPIEGWRCGGDVSV